MDDSAQNPLLNWIKDGETVSKEITGDYTTIGRHEDCDVVLDHSGISRVHASISRHDQNFYLEDMDSSLGIRLNGEPLKPREKYELKPGDSLKLGKFVLYFGNQEQAIREDLGPGSDIQFSAVRITEEIENFQSRMLNIIQNEVDDPEKSARVKSLISTELDHARNFFEAKLHEYVVLQEVTQIIVRILDVKELLATALKLVSNVMGANRGFIILYDHKHGNLRSMIPRHFDQSDGAYEFDLSFSQTIAKGCYDKKEIIIIEDALKDERFHTAQSIVASSIRSVICIPLQHGNEASGVIYLDNLNEPGKFKEHQSDFLYAFSCQTAIALENARLYTQAVTDGLTRLYNRKYVDERIYEEMVRSRRYERDCSVILLDIDHFKSVNDTHGHDFGDLVLELVANVLRENARTSDVVARYGGEEFLLLLTETDLRGARIFADRLRVAIESLEVNHSGKTLRVTVSCGVAAYHPDLRNDVQAFIKLADMALYRAKDTGRNRICWADSDQEE